MEKAGTILKSIFDSSDDVWFFVATNYSVIFFNNKAFKNGQVLHGRDLKVGDSILDYISETENSTDNTFIDCFNRALAGEIVKYDQYIEYHSNQYWFQSKYIPVYDQNKLAGVSITVSDITREKQMHAEQMQNQLEIKNLLYKREEFMSIAAHELKTPLAGIKAYNQLALRTIPADQVSYSFMIKSAEGISRLEKLIADLLDVTKLNAGKLAYDMAPFNLDYVLRSAVENVQQLCSTHNIQILESANVTVEGDSLRIEQVINNFLTNAVKYSPQASQVMVKSYTDGNYVIVSFRDFGIGIAPENLSRLFDRYYRVDSTSGAFQGLGLGLYIVAEILKRHNGSFWIESTLGVGSTFYFRLPVYANIDVTINL